VPDIPISRRRLLTGTLAFALSPRTPRVWAKSQFSDNPFTLGVASGYPTPDGFTLWTRLAPQPFEAGGGLPSAAVQVQWEIAHDDRFRHLVQRGETRAEPVWGHSVHVDVSGLPAGRAYCYRFRSGDALSPTGRTRTAPALESSPSLLRIAVASCQHYEHGYFSAYRHMLNDDLDLIVHVGDYIYEGSWGPEKVRKHTGPDPYTLDDFRIRHAVYKSDRDLQAAHAAYPWLCVWDDHEVENDYASDRSVYYPERDKFLARRRAAYQAYYEHLPLPARMRPSADGMRIHTTATWGRLAQLALLDTRQYRSYPPCRHAQTDEYGRTCGEFSDPNATLLGTAQEAWLARALQGSRAQWNLLAQQILCARSDEVPGPEEEVRTQSWDGYPAARTRLFKNLVDYHVSNPMVLSGDVHSFWVNDLRPDFRRPEQAPIAAEIVTTSISSYGGDDSYIDQVRQDAPHVKFATARFRGYARLDITAARATCDLLALVKVQDPNSRGFTLSSWVVEDQRPGINRA
jgi:alkaline phosphatase D